MLVVGSGGLWWWVGLVVVPKKKESGLKLFTLDFRLELDNTIHEKIPSLGSIEIGFFYDSTITIIHE